MCIVGCDSNPSGGENYSLIGVDVTTNGAADQSCGNSRSNNAIPAGSACASLATLLPNFYDFSNSPPTTTSQIYCSGQNTYSWTGDVSFGCGPVTATTFAGGNGFVVYGSNECANDLYVKADANCKINTNIAAHAYAFDNLGASASSVQPKCEAGSGLYTTSVTLAKGCDASTITVVGVSVSASDCPSSPRALQEGSSSTCTAYLATHYYDFTTPSAPVNSVLVKCKTAPDTYTPAGSNVVAYGCDGAPASVSDVSGSDTAGLDITTT
ncbi:unnamed protein product, partial [Rotaria sp. Silwood2]